MPETPSHPYSDADARIDRQGPRRRDETWIAARLRRRDSRIAVLRGLEVLVEPEGESEPRAVFLSGARAEELLVHAADRPLLLGIDLDGDRQLDQLGPRGNEVRSNEVRSTEVRSTEVSGTEVKSTEVSGDGEAGTAYFALELHGDDDALTGLGLPGTFTDLKAIGARLDRREASLLASARGLVYWHRRHRFCGDCGARTESADGGFLRRCTGCGSHHFPRTDPAIIVLVTEGEGDAERCLLGRQSTWAPGVYSTLAGFVEPGESLEDAVIREVCEEAGVPVHRVRYHSSQPWPFPSSLMLGFTARAGTIDARRDPSGSDDELEDARWFTRRELTEAVAEGRVRLPSEVSIARALIRGWLDGEECPGAEG